MEIITSGADLIPGDVIFVSRYLEPRGREAFWWRAFWIVRRSTSRTVDCLVLKMHPDHQRIYQFGEPADKQVIQYLHPDDYPQGVIAMRMKCIALGTIKLGDQ